MKRFSLVLALSTIAFIPTSNADEPPAQKQKQAEKFDDATFVKEAACAGMTEMKLGKLAIEKAESPEVKEFAKKMVADHAKASKKLMTVAKSAKCELPKEMSEKHQAVCEKLKNTDSASFDREYMKCMVKGHEEAVMLFEKGMNSQNVELRAFASEVLPIIKEHEKMAQELAAKVGVETEEKK